MHATPNDPQRHARAASNDAVPEGDARAAPNDAVPEGDARAAPNDAALKTKIGGGNGASERWWV